MAVSIRGRSMIRLGLVALLLTLTVGASATSPAASASAATRWTGGVDLYRAGVFTTQKSWLWCTAADIQIIRNIVDRQVDHSRSSQQRYFAYMRAHNRYNIPLKDGVDPAGWTAGLRQFVDARYRLVASRSFDSALRSAVTSLRKTNLPVAITVSHGNHAWVLTGFTATADPAATTHFTVTSVRVVGPLWGLQSRSYGYDMRPDTRLTPSQLRGFFTPWHYTSVPMAWENRWVSVQPIGASTPTPMAATQHALPPRPVATMPNANSSPQEPAMASPEPTTSAASSAEVAMLANPVASDPVPSAPTAGSSSVVRDAGAGATLAALGILSGVLVLVVTRILRSRRARHRAAARVAGMTPR
jgi:hypothetical protein